MFNHRLVKWAEFKELSSYLTATVATWKFERLWKFNWVGIRTKGSSVSGTKLSFTKSNFYPGLQLDGKIKNSGKWTFISENLSLFTKNIPQLWFQKPRQLRFEGSKCFQKWTRSCKSQLVTATASSCLQMKRSWTNFVPAMKKLSFENTST